MVYLQIEMIDFLNNDLNLNDEVVFVNFQGNYLQQGTITKITKTKVEISSREFPKSKTTAFPEHIIKLKQL